MEQQQSHESSFSDQKLLSEDTSSRDFISNNSKLKNYSNQDANLKDQAPLRKPSTPIVNLPPASYQTDDDHNDSFL